MEKSRIEQPYGFKEQNNLVTEPAMICNAITGGSASSKEIIEKINYILNRGFFSVEYDKGADSFVFKNATGEGLVALAKLEDIEFLDLIQETGYNPNTKNIFIQLENGERIKISLESLINQINQLIENESNERKTEDQNLWDAIGEVGESGSSLVEIINEEISARTDADEDILEKINSIIESGDSIIGLIDEISASTQTNGEEISELSGKTEQLEESISNEEQNRISADTKIESALTSEVSARESGDTALSDRIDEISSSISDSIDDLWEALSAETSGRTSTDAEIESALAAETSTRESDDAILNSEINNERSARESGDTALDDKIDRISSAISESIANILVTLNTEISERTSADTEILGALSAETNERTSGDTRLNNKINKEIQDRVKAINDEAEARESADTEIWEALSAETSGRTSDITSIREALDTEKSERISADGALNTLIEENKVEITKTTTGLPYNIKEAYHLKNNKDEYIGEPILIYKDSSLKDVELTDQDESGNTGQFLKFTYILENDEDKIEYVDVSQFLTQTEFKDGLTVNTSGEVSVKVDGSSEEYLTVGPNGLKISGINSIKADLESEITNRGTEIARVETLITEEGTNRMNGISGLRNELQDKIDILESADTEIESALTDEISARESGDTALNIKIDGEIETRTSLEQTLYSQIQSVSGGVDTETSARVSAVSNLQTQINSIKEFDNTISSVTTAISGAVTTEKEDRNRKDEELSEEISKKANSVDVYYKTEANGIFALKTEIPTDFYSKAEVDAKDSTINDSITNESDIREREYLELNRAITAETSARESAVSDLQTSINTINSELSSKLDEVKTKDASVTVDSTNATKPEIKVNISSESGQIIKLNGDGIYAKATLDYDEANNILVFTNTSGTTTIPFNTKSEIRDIRYNTITEEIVIEYTVHGEDKEVRVDVHDLIQEWRVEDGNPNGIKLERVVDVPYPDVLRASLVFAEHDDNVAELDGNALYVSKDKIIGNLEERIGDLERRIGELEARINILNP